MKVDSVFPILLLANRHNVCVTFQIKRDYFSLPSLLKCKYTRTR